MRIFLTVFFAYFLFNCSSSDNETADPTDDTPPIGTDIALSFKWEREDASYLPQGMVYDALDRPYLFLAGKAGGLIVFSDNGDLSLIHI